MKKFIYAALAVAAVLLFASCKNDKNQPKPEAGDAYVSFTFNLPQGGFRDGVADKNAEQEYAGTTAEQKISAVRVVLFDTNSREVKYALDYGITGAGNAAPTGEVVAGATAAKFTTKAKEVVSQDYLMLAIINPTQKVKDATAVGKFLKDAEAAIESTAAELSTGAILMSNDRGLVKVEATSLQATEGAAEGAPVAVSVDRILAKVFVGCTAPSGQPEFKTGKLTDIKWKLNTTNKKTFIFRQFGKYVKTMDVFEPETATDNSTRFQRYAQDPNFSGTFNPADFNYEEGTPTLNGTFGYADDNGQYCLENTMDASSQKIQQTTSFILSGVWTPENHDNITFTKGETWYSCQGFTFSKDKMVEYKKAIDKDTNNKLTHIDGTPRGFVDALRAALNGGLTVDAQGDVTASTTVKDVKAYKGGVCYYQTNLIRHFNDSQSSKTMGYGRYGVVRNNIYKINITKIERPGEPTVENDKDKDKNDDPDKAYISFEVTVNPWIVRTQDIAL